MLTHTVSPLESISITLYYTILYFILCDYKDTVSPLESIRIILHYIIFDNEINTASPLESHRQLYIYYAVCVCYEAPIYQKWLNPYGAA